MTLGVTASAQTLGVLTHNLLVGSAVADTDRDRDGLLGPVRRIRTETAKLTNKSGKSVEGMKQVLETAAYDLKGAKVENAYFPVTGAAALTGREMYKYDDKGNISEMTLYNADGSLLSKEIYTYEYDFVGNWTKMTTSVAVIEGGKLNFEPTEVTYRTISYYLDENLAKMVQPAAPNAATPAVAKPVTENASAPANTQKTAAVIPPSTDLSALNKSAANAGPVGSASVPGGSSNASNNNVVALEAEPPAKPAPKPLMKPVSGGVLNGKAVSLPAPDYPEAAKRMRASGVVSVDVVIDVSGKVISAKASNGNPILQQAATQAALRARFSPTTLSGQPVKVSGVINYNFSLNK
ncbi:MAG: energy transducer TonB [Acidobacteria bacterium]|nr:energy transducer TonB [Acidobacteriota bacterium]